MTGFDRFYKKENMVSKTLNIDEELYSKLEELSNNTYDASITKLVNASIEDLLKNKNIDVYKRKNKNQVSRSFLIRENFVEQLYKMKEEYSISINSLVNIAIRNELIEEKEDGQKTNSTFFKSC